MCANERLGASDTGLGGVAVLEVDADVIDSGACKCGGNVNVVEDAPESVDGLSIAQCAHDGVLHGGDLFVLWRRGAVANGGLRLREGAVLLAYRCEGDPGEALSRGEAWGAGGHWSGSKGAVAESGVFGNLRECHGDPVQCGNAW
jgi:hypothetical protein